MGENVTIEIEEVEMEPTKKEQIIETIKEYGQKAVTTGKKIAKKGAKYAPWAALIFLVGRETGRSSQSVADHTYYVEAASTQKNEGK